MPTKPSFDLTLYLVVGSDAVGGSSVEDVVAAALRGGVTVVQLREKTLPDDAMVALARRLKALAARHGVPLIVNDRIAVARAAGADGVHLGWDDEAAPAARARLGDAALVGLSAGTAEEALAVIGSAARFDLLLSDIGLPGDMNGHDLAAFAASARSGLKIVLMSAHTDPGAIGGVIDGNVSAFLRKPHRKEGLNNTLRRILDLDT